MPCLSAADENRRRLEGGRILARPPPGDEVVISGFAGRYPNSYNSAEFLSNLMNKVDLCDMDERRWEHTIPDVPKLSGKIDGPKEFDAGYFGVHTLQANSMCPMTRLIMERSVEAVMDAGINPASLKGKSVGVYIGACYSEAEKSSIFEMQTPKANAIAGTTRSSMANRISYSLQLRGPSHVCDTACSSGLFALELGYRAIREGKCEMAIIGSANLCFDPYTTLQFARLGVTNMDTGCRPFDEDAKGYTRSEAIIAVILQKKKDAKRVYAEVIHSKVNVDGYKEEGITYPSSEGQMALLDYIYEECEVDPTSLAYVEAHGTGTKVGDPEEILAIDKFFCTNRKKPLLCGSVKGNIGHTEPVSGLCSLVRVLFGMETGYIPPNIHFDNPRKDCTAIMEGRIKIITEPTPWPTDSSLAGINCFGFGGANAHVIIKRHEKEKRIVYDDLPRLVCFSSRTEEGITCFQDHLQNNQLDYEFVGLFHEIFGMEIPNHPYRGYSILLPNQEVGRSCSFHPGNKKTLHLCIGDAQKYRSSTIKELMRIKIFRDVAEQIKAYLDKTKQSANPLADDDTSNHLQQPVRTAMVQLGLVRLLADLQVTPDKITGLQNGVFAAAYARGSLTMEEAVAAVCAVADMQAKQKTIKNDLQAKIKAKLRQMFEHRNEVDVDALVDGLCNGSQVKGNERNVAVLSIGCDVKGSVELIKEYGRVEDLLAGIGRLYELGWQPQVQNLYTKVEFPVSRGTPPLSSIIRWRHKDYAVPYIGGGVGQRDNEISFTVSNTGPTNKFFTGHVIDGRNLYPATGYLTLIWDYYAQTKLCSPEELKLCLRNIKYHRATTFGKDGNKLFLTIQHDGNFEVCENDTLVVSGFIELLKEEMCDFEPTFKEKSRVPEMKKEDVYKEFRIRGYNYSGMFKAIEKVEGERGYIKWQNNWVTFLDNMLQLFILHEDVRYLLVPTGIDRMDVDLKKFLDYVNTLDEEQLVPVTVNRAMKEIKCNFIDIRGMRATSIQRKRQVCQPVLETYKFVPNELTTSLEESVRINMQIVLECKQAVDMKVLELCDDNDQEALRFLSPIVVSVLGDQPIVQPDVTLNTGKSVEGEDLTGIKVEDKGSNFEKNHVVCIGSNLLANEEVLQRTSKLIVDDGFLIAIEKDSKLKVPDQLNLFTKHSVGCKTIYLLRKKIKKGVPVTVDLSHEKDVSKWLEPAKSKLHQTDNLVVYAQNNPKSGLMGFYNCLNRETGQNKTSMVLVQDDAPPFSLDVPFYKEQLSKGMNVNVYRDGAWGTYRHMKMKNVDLVECHNYYANPSVRGDLSSLTWFEGNLRSDMDNIIQIYYSGINFRDVMEASGKLPFEAIAKTRLDNDSVLGLEFAGRDSRGKRVMGMVNTGAMSNMVQAVTCWEIPDDWTMEQAATVPAVYCTVLFALYTIDFKPGCSVLIHSATGGVGQAAIHIFTYYGCTIYVTVGTEEKRQFLLKNFPQIKESQIGNSRDTSFLQHIMNETNGVGVDVVLNSLAEEKLLASVKCLAPRGNFLEIGKYDLSNNNPLPLDFLNKEAHYCGITLDLVLTHSPEKFKIVTELLIDAIKKGIVKPLMTTCFEIDQLEATFRYMTTGRHMGKVVLKLREEEREKICKPAVMPHLAVPKYYCDSTLKYVILGGLGGFGLELADWLVLRGARKLVLSSRSGIRTGYQNYRINLWKSYGIEVTVSTDDVSTRQGCENLLKSSAPVGAIYNLAVNLKDGFFENQTVENFEASFLPKAVATGHLDELSRKLCPQLKQFVVFSSVSCGRGNQGQTNYGMSNSVMERICEARRRDGLPALAIQWGAVGDVGLVAEMQKDGAEIAIGGTLQQRISSCLEVMDKFLKQDDVVVSSTLVAEKYSRSTADNMIEAVLNILGHRDLKTVSLHSSLAELGMDSMMAVEIKQTLERDYDVFLSPQDMRNLTFARLLEINESKSGDGDAKKPETNGTKESSDIETDQDMMEQLKGLFNNIYDESTYKRATVMTTCRNSKKKVVLFPGIEGTYPSMKRLAENLKANSMCIQYRVKSQELTSIVDHYIPLVKHFLAKDKEYNFIAHSYGCLFALEMAAKLEKEGYKGKIVAIDSSVWMMKRLLNVFDLSSPLMFECSVLMAITSSALPSDALAALWKKLMEAPDFESRQALCMAELPDDAPAPKQVMMDLGTNIYNMIQMLYRYEPNYERIAGDVMLCKPTEVTVKDAEEDFQLSRTCSNVTKIDRYDGNHMSILNNADMYADINEHLGLH